MKRIGPYTLVKELARGGMGVVFRARDPGLGRHVALKLLLVALPEPEDLLRFRREAQAAARLRHPGIVTVHGLGTDRGHPYLVMDLVEGDSLAARLRQHGPLEPREAASVVAQVADVIDYAHGRGVLHRDIKPDNVLQGSDGRPRLTDFGLARIVDADDRLSQTGDIMGTPGFLSPEQALGDRRAVSERTDVHGLGGLLFALLTGSPPFERETVPATLGAVISEPAPPVSSRRPEVDGELAAICARALETDPEDRYPSAAVLAAALREWLGEEQAPVDAGLGLAARGASILAGLALGGVLAYAARGLAAPAPAPAPTPVPTPVAEAPPAWDGPRRRAKRLEAAGDLPGAVDAAGEALVVAPDRAELWTLHGDLSAAARQPLRAVRSWERALELSWNQRTCWQAIETLVALELPAQAVEHLNAILQRDPPNLRALSRRGYLRVRYFLDPAGGYDDLTAALDRGAEPEAELRTQRARALESMGRLQEAVDEFDRALRLKPGDLMTRAARALVLVNIEGSAAAALEEAEQALRQHPGNPQFSLVRARASMRLGVDLQRAEQDLRVALREFGDDPWICLDHVNLLNRLGRTQEAFMALHLIHKIAPGFPAALATEGEMLRVEGRYPEALQRFQQAWERFSDPREKERVARKIREVRANGIGPLKRVGSYELLEELGRGSLGVVYRARDPGLDRMVALKVLLLPTDQARFEREAKAVAALRHPNVVSVHGMGQAEGRPYVVSDLIEGASLAEHLRSGPLDPRRAAALARDLADAVEAAHQAHILHRDLRPENVLLEADGTPVLADFGLAQLGGLERRVSGEVEGAPAYLAPEQARGEVEAMGPLVDVHGLGAILYATLCGRPPFAGETLVEVLTAVAEQPPAPFPDGLDPELAGICLRCLAKAPAERTHSAGQLRDELSEWLQGGRAAAASGPGRRWPVVELGVGLLLGAAVGWLSAPTTAAPAPPAPPPPPPPAQPEPTPVSELLRSAETALRLGRSDDVERLVADVLAREPDAVAAYLLRARSRERAADHAGVQADASDVLRRVANHTGALLLRAKARFSLGRREEARADLQRYFDAGGERASGLEARARAAHLAGRQSEALGDLNEALVLDPRRWSSVRLRAVVLRYLGRPHEAAAMLSEVLDDPEAAAEPGLWEGYGKAFQETKDYERSRQAYVRAGALGYDRGWAKAGEAIALYMLGRLDDAIRVAGEGLEASPNHSWLLGIRGKAFYEQGRLAEAEQAMEAALVGDEDLPRAQRDLLTRQLEELRAVRAGRPPGR